MDNYTPNSHRFKQEQRESAAEKKQIKKVANGAAKVKKNEFRRFADVFISEDIKNVKSFIVMDVLVPTIKKAILSTVDMILNGGNGDYSRRSSSSRVSYRKFYDEPRESRRSLDEGARRRFDYDDIVFENRRVVDEVLEQMSDIIETYGFVTVADLYDIADLVAPETSNRYGWLSIRNAEVSSVRGGGYVIKLPRAVPIDR